MSPSRKLFARSILPQVAVTQIPLSSHCQALSTEQWSFIEVFIEKVEGRAYITRRCFKTLSQHFNALKISPARPHPLDVTGSSSLTPIPSLFCSLLSWVFFLVSLFGKDSGCLFFMSSNVFSLCLREWLWNAWLNPASLSYQCQSYLLPRWCTKSCWLQQLSPNISKYSAK